MMTDDQAVQPDEAQAMVLAPTPDMQLVRDPNESLEEAGRAAAALIGLVTQKQLSVKVSGGEHLKVEGWQTIASWYGLTYGCDRIEDLRDQDGHLVGFRAYAYAQSPRGGRWDASASCRRDEANWQDKPLFQLESMAQTRAISKVLRTAVGWVAIVAGYSATPAEEVAPDLGGTRPADPPKPKRPSRAKPPAEAMSVGPIEIEGTAVGAATERVPTTKGDVLQYGFEKYGWGSAMVLEVLRLATVTDIEPGLEAIEKMDAYAAEQA